MLHSSFLSIYQFDMILIIGLTIILEHAFSLKNIFKKIICLIKLKNTFKNIKKIINSIFWINTLKIIILKIF